MDIWITFPLSSALSLSLPFFCSLLHFELNFKDFHWRNGRWHHEVPRTRSASAGALAPFQSAPSAPSLNGWKLLRTAARRFKTGEMSLMVVDWWWTHPADKHTVHENRDSKSADVEPEWIKNLTNEQLLLRTVTAPLAWTTEQCACGRKAQLDPVVPFNLHPAVTLCSELIPRLNGSPVNLMFVTQHLLIME